MARGWRITGYRIREAVIEHWVSGSATDKDIREILSRLQARHLTEAEIVAASLPEGAAGRTNMLDAHPRMDGLGAYRTSGGLWSYVARHEDADAARS